MMEVAFKAFVSIGLAAGATVATLTLFRADYHGTAICTLVCYAITAWAVWTRI